VFHIGAEKSMPLFLPLPAGEFLRPASGGPPLNTDPAMARTLSAFRS
jgi:hypothetical protein